MASLLTTSSNLAVPAWEQFVFAITLLSWLDPWEIKAEVISGRALQLTYVALSQYLNNYFQYIVKQSCLILIFKAQVKKKPLNVCEM